MNMDTMIREQARLIIMKALAEQPDETLNSDILEPLLRTFGIRKPRSWVHEEMAYLAEHGAAVVVAAGSVHVATLTDKGQRHLQREIAIEGIKRPSRPGE
ncbi:MAG: hypothetical protein M9955_13410 [Rhizobiaceae bacterium]|jgi:hypothetical protein|nr:hypothetical protein [Rhizobiaceae bacterium]